MIKIKISYQREQELAGFINLIKPHVYSVKIAKEQRGQYKRAYVDVELNIESREAPG